MKKKNISIFVIITVLVCTIIAAVLILKLIKEDSDLPSMNKDNLQSGSEMIIASTVEDVFVYAKEYGLHIVEGEDGILTVNDLSCYELPMQVQYYPTQNGKELYQVDLYFVPFSNEYKKVENPQFTHSGSDLKTEMEKFCGVVNKVFNVNVNGKYFIISNEGILLDSKLDSSYEALISGSASVDFTLRDRNQNYWILTSGLSEEGIVYFKFTNYFDLETYTENIAHITAR